MKAGRSRERIGREDGLTAMRFSSPSQLVRDAQRHGVKVLPVDVAISVWDSSLEHSAGIVADYLGLSVLRLVDIRSNCCGRSCSQTG
ncbi:hypothetical protein OKW26_006989 [Paraburkholderia sp. 32]